MESTVKFVNYLELNYLKKMEYIEKLNRLLAFIKIKDLTPHEHYRIGKLERHGKKYGDPLDSSFLWIRKYFPTFLIITLPCLIFI